MSKRARVPKTQPRISQAWRGDLLPALIDLERKLCSSPTAPVPVGFSSAWQDSENDAKTRKGWFTHVLLLQPDTWQMTDYGSTAARWQRRPYRDAFQEEVSIERHLSRIFPAHPRSLARCWSRARRHSAFCFGCAALRVWVSKEKSRPKYRQDFSSEPPQKDTPSALGSGAPRVASRKSVPRAIRANTNRRKTMALY